MFDRMRTIFDFFRTADINSPDRADQYAEAMDFIRENNKRQRLGIELAAILSSGWNFGSLRNPEYCRKFTADVLARQTTEQELTMRQAALLGHVRRHYAVWDYNRRIRPFNMVVPR